MRPAATTGSCSQGWQFLLSVAVAEKNETPPASPRVCCAVFSSGSGWRSLHQRPPPLMSQHQRPRPLRRQGACPRLLPCPILPRWPRGPARRTTRPDGCIRPTQPRVGGPSPHMVAGGAPRAVGPGRGRNRPAGAQYLTHTYRPETNGKPWRWICS